MRTSNPHLIYGDELVLLAKDETVLQGMIDRLLLKNFMERKRIWKNLL
jgi:hypothetical protein